MKQAIAPLLLALICFSFSSDVQKRIIRENGFDIECYITSKKVNHYSSNKMYYWYRSGKIHQSVSNVGGFLLHKNYTKYYKSNQLAEQGEFVHGLKHGVWKTWHKNGLVKTKTYWEHGYREWHFTAYDSFGNITLQGNYRKNIKTGQWIDHIKKDTVYYKNNIPLEEKPIGIIQRVLRKRDSLEKVQIKQERITKRLNDSIKRVQLKRERLLKKRNDSIDKARKKINKQRQKKIDSINRSKQTNKGFLKRLFKKNNKKQG
ncbi:hypothetical protein [Seonamhaeicola sp.]|uniref:toxin-antitoxin system YwqK family antitoxin n=1 Tax=Seonamhaeicola sp. TaxID=1912245 RepID=UPI002603CFBA|nr:hypothetical protein [Seonamhaeicola sp.]